MKNRCKPGNKNVIITANNIGINIFVPPKWIGAQTLSSFLQYNDNNSWNNGKSSLHHAERECVSALSLSHSHSRSALNITSKYYKTDKNTNKSMWITWYDCDCVSIQWHTIQRIFNRSCVCISDHRIKKHMLHFLLVVPTQNYIKS